MIHDASREAVLALLRSIIASDSSPGNADDFRELDAGRLIQIASTQSVLPLIYVGVGRNTAVRAGLPADAILFLQEIWKANEARNSRMRAELASIGALFATHDIMGVVLKGGCELIQPSHPEAGSRFLSDLDLLVPKGHLSRARALLVEQGYVDEDASVLFGDHHHLPTLRHPDRNICVELHSCIGSGKADQILPASELLSSSQSSKCEGILVPSCEHRMAHLVTHAQLNNKGYRDSAFTLRDLVDFHGINTQLSVEDLSAVRERFRRAGCAEFFDGMASAAELLGPKALVDTSAGGVWAKRATQNFQQGRKRRPFYVLLRLQALVRDSALRKQFRHLILHPKQVARIFILHRERMRRIH